MDIMEGATLYINKPYGMSSFGALARVRYILSRKLGVRHVKVGHAGTLDPLATGVLILCTGKKTKDIEGMKHLDKEYVATLQLGATTASFDKEHPVDATYPTSHITLPLIETTLRGFVGDIMQEPPVYSACKIGGRRAYRMARGGEEVALAPKQVRINALELLRFDPEMMTLEIRVECGKGTYIRALARDIGRALCSGAYLTALCRTRVGDVGIDQCVALDQFPAYIDRELGLDNKVI